MYVDYNDFDPNRLVLIDGESKEDYLICYNYNLGPNPTIKVLTVEGPPVKSYRGISYRTGYGAEHDIKTYIGEDFLPFWKKLHQGITKLAKDKGLDVEVKYPIDITEDGTFKTLKIHPFNNKVFYIEFEDKYVPGSSDKNSCGCGWSTLKEVYMVFSPVISFDRFSILNKTGYISSELLSANVESYRKIGKN